MLNCFGFPSYRATIARNEETFWTDVFSEYILDKSDNSASVQICSTTTSSAHIVTSSLSVVFVSILALLSVHF